MVVGSTAGCHGCFPRPRVPGCSPSSNFYPGEASEIPLAQAKVKDSQGQEEPGEYPQSPLPEEDPEPALLKVGVLRLQGHSTQRTHCCC